MDAAEADVSVLRIHLVDNMILFTPRISRAIAANPVRVCPRPTHRSPVRGGIMDVARNCIREP